MTKKEKIKKQFADKLNAAVADLSESISCPNGDWIVKGFIDIAKNIYTISVDTKVVSKIVELLIFPNLCTFAKNNNYKIILSKEQNFYPDLTFVDGDGNKFAVDIKTTYRKDDQSVSGMTLGAFTGYFRDRKSSKNTTFPYDEYIGHFVLGIIYSRTGKEIDERKVYQIKDLKNIPSVIADFQFFIQEKYKIAIDRPGSGNTKNIGSVCKINDLVNGNGPFAVLGENIFDDYWRNYLTNDMAKAAELEKPYYTNLQQYKTFKNIK